MQPLQLIRTHSAHVGTAPITSTMVPKTMAETSSVEGKTTVESRGSFQNYLLDALNYVNNKQIRQTDIANQLIVDPDSVDVHDVTTAMAEASMSLELAQTVIDRVITGWNEITTTR